jgi:hypothetical protein
MGGIVSMKIIGTLKEIIIDIIRAIEIIRASEMDRRKHGNHGEHRDHTV